MKIEKKIFLAEYPDEIVITEKSKRLDSLQPTEGSVRLAQGRYRTTEEEEARREKILHTPLP